MVFLYMHNSKIGKDEDPSDFINRQIKKYKNAKSLSERRRINALVAMNLSTGNIGQLDFERFNQTK